MPVEIKAAGSASPGTLISPRIKDGLVGMYHFLGSDYGGTLEYAVQNHAPGGDAFPLSPVGSPQVLAKGVGLRSAFNYFDTGMPDLSAFTYITVAKTDTVSDATNATAPIFVGNYTTDNGNAGSSLHFNSAGRLAVSAQTQVSADGTGSTISGANSAAIITDKDKWRLIAGRFILGQGLTLFNVTDGTRVDLATTNIRKLSPYTAKIGSGHNNTFQGPNQQIVAYRYNRGLSDAEILVQIAAEARALAAKQGITGI